MLVIRLSRTGRKKTPHYRVVVAEKSAPIQGKHIEVLGHYDPRTKELKVDEARAKARLAAGAQPSETAEALLEKAGILKREPITEKNRRPERKKKKEAKAEGDAAPAAGGEAAPTEDAPAEESKPDEPKPEESKPDAKSDDTPEAKDGSKEATKDEKAEEPKGDE